MQNIINYAKYNSHYLFIPVITPSVWIANVMIANTNIIILFFNVKELGKKNKTAIKRSDPNDLCK